MQIEKITDIDLLMPSLEDIHKSWQTYYYTGQEYFDNRVSTAEKILHSFLPNSLSKRHEYGEIYLNKVRHEKLPQKIRISPEVAFFLQGAEFERGENQYLKRYANEFVELAQDPDTASKVFDVTADEVMRVMINRRNIAEKVFGQYHLCSDEDGLYLSLGRIDVTTTITGKGRFRDPVVKTSSNLHRSAGDDMGPIRVPTLEELMAKRINTDNSLQEDSSWVELAEGKKWGDRVQDERPYEDRRR